MSYEAAKIINKIAGKGVKMAGYQGIRLGTITSVSPIKLKVDNINFEMNSDSLVVSSALLEQESLKVGDRVATAQIDIKIWVILCKVVNP